MEAYGEYLSRGAIIPDIVFDANLLRTRYCTLFWDYARKKQNTNAVSDNEVSSKIGQL